MILFGFLFVLGRIENTKTHIKSKKVLALKVAIIYFYVNTQHSNPHGRMENECQMSDARKGEPGNHKGGNGLLMKVIEAS